jgi:hypothetical protein
VALGWVRSGQNRGEAPPTEPELRRRATIALASNLVVALFLFGLLSIPGAISAGMARRAAARDPDRAARLIRWSWAFLITNALFYLLLLVVVLVIGGYLYLIARSRT